MKEICEAPQSRIAAINYEFDQKGGDGDPDLGTRTAGAATPRAILGCDTQLSEHSPALVGEWGKWDEIR